MHLAIAASLSLLKYSLLTSQQQSGFTAWFRIDSVWGQIAVGWFLPVSYSIIENYNIEDN